MSAGSVSETNAPARIVTDEEAAGLRSLVQAEGGVHPSHAADLTALLDSREAFLEALAAGTFSLEYDEGRHDYTLHYVASYDDAERLRDLVDRSRGEL